MLKLDTVKCLFFDRITNELTFSNCKSMATSKDYQCLSAVLVDLIKRNEGLVNNVGSFLRSPILNIR